MIDVSVFFLYNGSLQYLNVNVYITWKNTKYDDLSKRNVLPSVVIAYQVIDLEREAKYLCNVWKI